MISKASAEALADQYRTSFRDRLVRYLTNRASGGLIGGQVTYADVDGITPAIGSALRADFEAAGWTVVVDTTAKTVTFS